MTWWAIAYILLAVLLCGSVWLAAPKRTWAAVSAICVFVLFVLSFGMTEGIGRPKPVRIEWRDPSKVILLAHKFVEGKAIYLWISVPGNDTPMAYVLPWSLETAKDIQRAQREGKGQRGVVIEDLFKKSWENRKPMIYAMPQRAMPPKQGEYGPDGT